MKEEYDFSKGERGKFYRPNVELNLPVYRRRRMSVNEALASVQFVVDKKGNPTGAILDISAWQTLVEILENAEDQGLFQAYFDRQRQADSPEEMGLIPWEEAEAALDALEAVEHAHLD